MKQRIFVLGTTLLLLLGLSIAHALAASSVTYLGKSTWTATITDDTDSGQIGATFSVTGGISKVGDEFYLFQGYVTTGMSGPFIMTGSGILIGDTLYFTLVESQQHTGSDRDGGVMHVEIDKTSQNGTFYDIGHDFNTTSRAFSQRFSAGSLTRTGSPIPINASLASQQLLLLD
jgi:hypothetical protein